MRTWVYDMQTRPLYIVSGALGSLVFFVYDGTVTLADRRIYGSGQIRFLRSSPRVLPRVLEP